MFAVYTLSLPVITQEQTASESSINLHRKPLILHDHFSLVFVWAAVSCVVQSAESGSSNIVATCALTLSFCLVLQIHAAFAIGKG